VTTSQTIGPFFHDGVAWAFDAGSGPIELVIDVLDADGRPVDDALLETDGLLRLPTDERGEATFHIDERGARVTVFARGLLKHLFTAVFLPGETSELLEQVPEARRGTLIARPDGKNRYRWTIRLQGRNETVFFEYT
jgi:protocatechuate 3,4-dioxygenase alpha subunit